VGLQTYRNARSYSFDSNSGLYTLYNGASVTIQPSPYCTDICTMQIVGQTYHVYGSYPGYGSQSPIIYEGWRTENGYPGYGSLSNDPTRSTVGIYSISFDGYISFYKRYSTSYYYKGDYIGVSNGATLNAYPTDARADDGYWYIAI